MNTSELKKEFDKTMQELLQMVAAFEQEQLNIIPFEGSWTAGQVAQHMIIANDGFADVMNGPVKDTDGPVDAMVEGIKNSFLNFNIKMQSPEFIVPEFRQYQKEEQLRSIELIRMNIDQVIDKADLTKTCTSFELPVVGFVTRWEAIHFVMYHTQRHIHQLKKIYQKLNTGAYVAPSIK